MRAMCPLRREARRYGLEKVDFARASGALEEELPVVATILNVVTDVFTDGGLLLVEWAV